MTRATCESDPAQTKITAQRPTGKVDEKLEQTISLSLKRIALKEKARSLDMHPRFALTEPQEMMLLYYSVTSARIFFRADQVPQSTCDT